MRTYLISFDIAAPERRTLADAIMQLGEAWARPLDTTWYVQSTERVDTIEQRLRPYVDGADGLLIQEVEASALLLLNTALRWLGSADRRLSPRPATPWRSLPDPKANSHLPPRDSIRTASTVWDPLRRLGAHANTRMRCGGLHGTLLVRQRLPPRSLGVLKTRGMRCGVS